MMNSSSLSCKVQHCEKKNSKQRHNLKKKIKKSVVNEMHMHDEREEEWGKNDINRVIYNRGKENSKEWYVDTFLQL